MKVLISPLLLLLLILLILWIAYGWRIRLHRIGRLCWMSVGLLMFALYSVSTPFGSGILKNTLTTQMRHAVWAAPEHGVSRGNSSEEPEYILVLAGGFVRGGKPAEDVLALETALRVAHAVEWAQYYGQAQLVFVGNSDRATGLDDANRSGRSMVDLMRDFAIGRGIARDRCHVEYASRNTREHPLGVLALPGIETSSRLLVVSSDWHLPRVRQVFDPVFDNVVYSGSTLVPPPRPLWQKLLPDEYALAESTLYIREWVGRGWYRL